MFPEVLSSATALGWPSFAIVGLVLSFRLIAMIIAVRAGYSLTQGVFGFTFQPGPSKLPNPDDAASIAPPKHVLKGWPPRQRANSENRIKRLSEDGLTRLSDE